jgi:hypothetical protein
VGLLTAYPINLWLVRAGLKHGMGTVRALGKGGHSLAAEWRRLNELFGGALGPQPELSAAHGAHQHGGK